MVFGIYNCKAGKEGSLCSHQAAFVVVCL